MRPKKSLIELFEEINPLLEKGKYFEAGFIAENYGYKELSEKYYAYARKKFKEEIILNSLKTEINPIIKNASKIFPPFLIKEDDVLNEKVGIDSSLYKFYGIVNEIDKPYKRN